MFQAGPKISNFGPYYHMDWGIGTPRRTVGAAYVGRSFEAPKCGNLPHYVYRRDLARPWLPQGVVEIPRGEIDAIYSCTTSAWDNLAPDRASCARPESNIGHTNWRKWC
ncbi:hypothetical protein MAR_ORF410 [Marseillevirus marseillevirus]|uniref:Uncharacterized protein n=1 Tax=Marseillevirus marseillevirus TaxID=694581 RepID=D2XB45_GBMV|nr:hypothetical protein MAR_ORF410 [Marseillevirus marseillevirus]ADB04172.1 hypothetical protein MAR_ORF410 [Marseillevirus marseillevirus]